MPEIDSLREALREVIDPEVGLDIVTLGLVYELTAAEDGTVDVRMTMTSRGCPMQGIITEGTRRVLEAQPDVFKVAIEVVWEPAWTPTMIDPKGRALLGF